MFGLVGAGFCVPEGVDDRVELELALLDFFGLEAPLDGLDVLVSTLDEARIEGLDDGLFVFFVLFLLFVDGSRLDLDLLFCFLLGLFRLLDIFFG